MKQLIMRAFYVDVKGLTRQFATRVLDDWKYTIEREKLNFPEDIKEKYYVHDIIIPSDKYLVEVIYPTKERDVIPQFMSEVEREKLIQDVMTYPLDKLDKTEKKDVGILNRLCDEINKSYCPEKIIEKKEDNQPLTDHTFENGSYGWIDF